VLRALCDFLIECYKDQIKPRLPQNIVRSIKGEIRSEKFDGFVRLDVSDFYPTIKHLKLSERLRQKISNANIITFIESAIKTATVFKSSSTDKFSNRGVPQGLSISNILAEIYLLDIDKYMLKYSGIVYQRYVDDILILCDEKKAEEISCEVIEKFRQIELEIHDPKNTSGKSVIGKMDEKFNYLGYEFKGKNIKPREASIEKLKESLASIFTGYKYSKTKSKTFLLWRLNLRITGCIFQNKSRGWMFFFSEINDESILHNLDRYVEKLASRFHVTISTNKFVKTYYEIKHSKYNTKYIPNFDKYTLEQMKEVLKTYFSMKNVDSLADEKVKYEFERRIDKQVKDLLIDVQNLGIS
jgi:hypothetical protein